MDESRSDQRLRFRIGDLFFVTGLVSYLCGLIAYGASDAGVRLVEFLEKATPPPIGIAALVIYTILLLASPFWLVLLVLSQKLIPRWLCIANASPVIILIVMLFLGEGKETLPVVIALSLGGLWLWRGS
ncbi:hypothetical protein DTL42_08875 [Bremerella cremea]|uniref:Uncharacterized protein n=1 Tax=Bremerella cremea TaxID=1031537 RepID=A0A368KVL2_9BACT|nr:hypothetical protein DTL42_08875 [Bremerella cremea]